MVSRGVRGSSGVAGGLAVLAGCALIAGCGGPSAPPSRPSPTPSARASGEALATRVCGGARQAAAKALGSPLTMRIVNPAAASLQCLLTGHQVQVSVGSQAGPRAYTEFDTETSHQDQVYGNGGVHDPSQFPQAITVPGSAVAVWIPAQLLLVATDAKLFGGGAYVTVAVTGRAAPAKVALRVATAAARATFAAHPDGPS